MDVIIHYSEIGTKGKNRGYFENKLAENLQRSLKGSIDKVYKRYGVIICDGCKDKESVKEKLAKIPGIANFSFGVKAELDVRDIKKKVLEILESETFESFKVNTRRSNKDFYKTSEEINIELGDLIRQELGKKVVMANPDKELFIEIGEKEAFIYTDKIKSVGGLPSGVSGKTVVSLSGGIDSPVASHLMMKRGCEVVFAHFYNETATGEAALGKIEKLVRTLDKSQLNSKLYIVQFEKLQKEIIKNVPAELRMIVYRRYMMRILNLIVKREGGKGIVTGDSVGQVASQTLDNLELIYNVCDRNVFSPLIGMNKEEIIDISRKIGTFDISVLPYEDCCSFMIAKHPETHGDLEDIEKFEGQIDDALVEKAVLEAKIKHF